MKYPEDPRSMRAHLARGDYWPDGRPGGRKNRGAPIVDQDVADDSDDAEWDEVADIICAGRGRLGIAVAAAARRAGLDVTMADNASGTTADSETGELGGLLGIDDDETIEYLRALTEDFAPLPAVDPVISTRVVDGPLRQELVRGGRIGTFFGAALRDWGRACMASPYGVLYTKVADPRLSVTYASATGPVEATVLDTVDIDPDRPADSLELWLTGLEQDLGDDIPPAGALRRLVFDDGVVVGAVLESASGARAVRARHGVMLSLGDGVSAGGDIGELDLRETAEVALVSRLASRFARLELLTRNQP